MRIALPNKGRLHDPAMDLLERAGLPVVDGAERRLYAATVDPEVTVIFARAADIPEYVADGAADLGVTGIDQLHEAGVENVVELLDLGFGRCKVVLAAPEDGPIEGPADLDGKTVATEFPGITRRYFEERGVDTSIITVSGATELTPHVDMADAIVDLTSTGTTLRMNRLAILDDILESTVHLIAREDVVGEEKVAQIRTALQAVLSAEGKRYIMMNAPRSNLEAIKEVIPGLGGPTVMDVAGDDLVAIHAVVDEHDVFETINDVRELGASGILVTEIERLIE